MKAYEIVVNNIIEKMEKEGISWKKAWKGGNRKASINGLTQKKYRGVNYFITTLLNPYTSNEWYTFNQVREKGGSVLKGESGTPIIFWSIQKKTNEEGEEEETAFTKYYTIFNKCQTTLYTEEEKAQDEAIIKQIDFNPIPKAENLFNDYIEKEQIKLEFKEQRAFYNRIEDLINMPLKDSFKNETEYYSTAFHEAGHSTGHQKRLERKELLSSAAFGDKNYSEEELTAELTAAFILNDLKIETEETEENHAAYLGSWLKVLKKDKKMLLIAAQRAEKASNYIRNTENNEAE